MVNSEQFPSPSPIEPARQRIFEDLRRYREMQRIKLGDLRGVYGEDELRRDQEKIAARRNRFEKVLSEDNIGVIAEAAFHKNINSGARIFGDRALATLLSEYDDYGLSDSENQKERGAWSDEVVELFPPEPSTAPSASPPYRFVMGIDITANITPKALELKLLGVKSGLDTGRLATVKYFKSDEPRFKYHYAGRLQGIPRAVVAADADSVWRVAELTDRVERGETRASPSLQNDPLVRVSIAELVMQFDAFREHAERVTGNKETEQKFGDGLTHLKLILKEKGITKERLSDRAVISNPALRALGSVLITLGFRVRSPAEIL